MIEYFLVELFLGNRLIPSDQHDLHIFGNLPCLLPVKDDIGCVDSVHNGHVFVKHDKFIWHVLTAASLRASFQVRLNPLQRFLPMVDLIDGAHVVVLQETFQSDNVEGLVIGYEDFRAPARLAVTLLTLIYVDDIEVH